MHIPDAEAGEAAYWLAKALGQQGDAKAAAELQLKARALLRLSGLPRDRQLLSRLGEHGT